ncbi:spindle and kinetochore-associated protein 1-like [Chelonus insularis]|uniref:spindle and kinetochore-associated protein 1-like n=1 Tax=Chelonus insularis TaxID=460826 RepID=UPI00158E5830|nr:spindle and kinetochore-associated protein 1-like [Chelonus insularis]
MLQTLDDIMKDQLKTANELDVATTFFLNKDIVKESLIAATKDVHSIKSGLCDMKKYLERMKKQNEICQELISCYNSFNTKIKYLENNIPQSLIQALQKPNNQTEEKKESKPPLKKIKPNGTTPATIQSVNSQQRTEGLNSINDINASELFSDVQDCRKTLFKEETEDSYFIEPLSETEFSKIPKYMIGRQNITNVNDFISTINNVLKAKYSILALGKIGARKKGELELYLQFKKEETDVYPNSGSEKKYFFTAEDYYRETKLKLDKIKLNLLTVLRHSKRIQELRNGKAVKYEVITAN